MGLSDTLTVLLTKFKGLLYKTNPYAVMSIEAINWVRNYMPEVIHLLPNMIGLDDLIQKALKDTRNPELTNFIWNVGCCRILEPNSTIRHVSMRVSPLS